MSNTFEILTRGRCNFCGGKWYEGDVQHLKNGDVVIRPKCSTDGLGYYVDPETVSPFVQRVDKKGKKVFLGDICRYSGLEAGESGVEDLFFVGYYDEDGSFTIDGRNAEFLPSKRSFTEDIEVIGNKWDDPELYERIKGVS